MRVRVRVFKCVCVVRCALACDVVMCCVLSVVVGLMCWCGVSVVSRVVLSGVCVFLFLFCLCVVCVRAVFV